MRKVWIFDELLEYNSGASCENLTNTINSKMKEVFGELIDVKFHEFTGKFDGKDEKIQRITVIYETRKANAEMCKDK